MADYMTVQTASINGLDWCEIDFPHDIGIARKMVAQWQTQETNDLPSASAS
jgi:choline kinase